jgi:hypothetical protein
MRVLAGLVAMAAMLMGALPAAAGGYWDVQPATPPPAYADGPPPCRQGCPPPPPCGCERGYHREAAWREERPLPPPPPPAPRPVVLPSEFFETESSVGPAFADYGYGGGGGGFEETGAFGEASAFASASASAHVSVDVRVMQHMMHQRMPPHPAPHGCGCSGHRW